MGITGLEPAHLAALEPKTSASTVSAISPDGVLCFEHSYLLSVLADNAPDTGCQDRTGLIQIQVCGVFTPPWTIHSPFSVKTEGRWAIITGKHTRLSQNQA